MSSSSSLPRWEYDVFLNFRGADTRKNFVAHLYTALDQRGIRTFKDNKKLERGKSISTELVKHINESRIAVIVFSENYASSSWCLDELVEILECSKTKGQIVLPLFYHVKASQVRHQKRNFEEAFSKHEEIHKEDMKKVQRWRAALKAAANISGLDLEDASNGYEDKFIQQIVQEISKKLGHRPFKVAEYEVGINSRVNKVIMLLNDKSTENKLFVGICGIGGIGKTTVAKAVFNRISNEFEGSCFLENVREELTKQDGLAKLQQKFLRETLMDNYLKISHSDRGINEINDRLKHKKILVVLDDVNHENQLRSLAGIGHNWFGSGSKIIITTRNQWLLTKNNVKAYKAELLDDNEALELFSWHAFKHNNPLEKYQELSHRVKYYANGLPLALQVLGSFLCGRSIPEWVSELDKLKSNPPKEIQDILRISYDDLDKMEKAIFLDIACFFKGYDAKFATCVFQSCGFHPIIGIKVLIEKSLITISKYNTLKMHDLIQEMGREIVLQESEDPGRRSRLWSYKDIHEVFTKNTVTESIEAIMLTKNGSSRGVDFFEGGLHVSADAFTKMRKLRILKISSVQLLGCLTYLSNELRYLDWNGYPGEYFPSNFHPKRLAALHLSHSPFKGIWTNIKFLGMLKVIKLSFCKNLPEKGLNFSGFPFLEELHLIRCQSLIEVKFDDVKFPGSLKKVNIWWCKNLKKASNLFGLPSLEELRLIGCENLRSFPRIISLKFLRCLEISKCSKFEKFPEIQGDVKYLKLLRLDGTAIKELPPSVKHLKRLGKLYLRDCKVLESLPNGIGKLKSLQTLVLRGTRIKELPSSIAQLKGVSFFDLRNCESLERLPNDICKMKSLESVFLNGTFIKDLPPLIEHLKCLKRLDLTDCKMLRILPSNIDEMESLQFLGLTRSGIKKLPPSIAQLTNLTQLSWNNCNLNEESILNLPHSLMDLDLGGNDFASLPASFSQLTHLSILELNGCLRLKTLESLPSSLLKVYAQGCLSLERHSIPKRESISFDEQWLFTESRKLVGDDGNNKSNICYSESQLQEMGDISILLPGSEIPSWFRHKSYIDGSLFLRLPLVCYSNFKGVAVCAVIGINHKHVPSDDDDDEEPFTRWCKFNLCMDGYQETFPVSDRFYNITSDHIAFSYITLESFSQRLAIKDWEWNSDKPYNYIESQMAGLRPDGPFKLKKWGIHLVMDAQDEDA